MKTSIIPAQITTVEDTIAGNFTLTQILLFLTPLFVAVFLYVVLPVRLHFGTYKLALIGIVMLLSFILALRIKGKIILHWLFILSVYNLRPRYYISNKNDATFRSIASHLDEMTNSIPSPNLITNDLEQKKIALSVEQSSRLKRFINTPGSTVRFRFKKGGVHVDTFQVSS
jgi:hypothetical protein